jgi:hypothetical protein
MSPYYVDSSSDKTRELDLIVEKQWMAQSLGATFVNPKGGSVKEEGRPREAGGM